MHRMKWVPKATLTEKKDLKNDQVRPPESSPFPSLQPKSRHKHNRHAKKAPKIEDPLYAAVLADQPHEIKSLIKRGADPNKRYGIMGDTLLHSAAMRNKKQAVLALIEMKANVNVNPTVSREMPFLLSRGTPLHVAAGHGHMEIIGILLRAEAKVNLQDAMGDTPLHKAVYGSYKSHKATIEALLQAGADTTIKNKKGLTPAVAAIEWGEPEIAALLIKWEFPKPEDQLKALQQIMKPSTSTSKPCF